MSSNLSGKTVVVIGGSSGIGFGVAKAALLERAAHVIIGSSQKDKVEDALKRLKADTVNAAIEGKLTGDVLDGKSLASVESFFAKAGEIDHLVWTSGDLVAPGGALEDSKGEQDCIRRTAHKLKDLKESLMCDSGEPHSLLKWQRFVKEDL